MSPIVPVHQQPLLPTHVRSAIAPVRQAVGPVPAGSRADQPVLRLKGIFNCAPEWATVRRRVLGAAAVIGVFSLLYVTVLQSLLHWEHPSQHAGASQARLQSGLDAAQKLWVNPLDATSHSTRLLHPGCAVHSPAYHQR